MMLWAQTSGVTRTSAFEYDTKGFLKKEVIEPDKAEFCVQTEYTIDAYGNRGTAKTKACSAADTEARGSSSKYEAQTVVIEGKSFAVAGGQFPTSSTNALGHTETKQYDPRTGAVVALKGPNGLSTTWEYDAFGRKTKESRADGTYSTWEYRFCGEAQSDGVAAPCTKGQVLNQHALVWYVAESHYSSAKALLGPRTYQIHDSLDRCH